MEDLNNNIKDYISYAPKNEDKRWLHVAAFIYVLPCIYDLICIFPSLNPSLNGVHDINEYFARTYMCGTIQQLLCIVALIILIRRANDRMSRIAVACGIVSNFMFLALNAIQFYNYSSSFPSSDLSDQLVSAMRIWGILDSLLWVYIYSLLQQNKWLSVSSRYWILFLAVSQVYGIIVWNVSHVYDAAMPFYIPNRISDSYYCLFYMGSSIFKIWRFVYGVLLICACLKFAHCEIFYGDYDDTPIEKDRFNPLNKYMLAAVVGSVVALGLLWLLYSNAELFV